MKIVLDKIGGVCETTIDFLPVVLVLRRVAAEGENVADTLLTI